MCTNIRHCISIFFSVLTVLLWLLTAACIKSEHPHIAKRAIVVAEKRLLNDKWPESDDRNQTWSIVGYIVVKMMLDDVTDLGLRFRSSLMLDKLEPVLMRSASYIRGHLGIHNKCVITI